MRIVIDARESGTSTGRYIDQLILHLNELDSSHKFIILAKPSRLQFFKTHAPKFEIVESNYKEFTFSEQLGFAWQLYRLGADLVHFNAPQQPLLYVRPSVTTVHDLTTVRFNNPDKNLIIYKFKQQVYKFVINVVARRAKRIIAISNFVKADLVKFTGINPTKVDVIYEAALKITDRPEPVPKLKDKKFIMYTGRPLPHKNLRRLIDAFAILQDDNPELRLALVGKKYGPYEDHEKYVKSKAISNVVFTDFVSDGQLRWLYENTSAYVVPSLSEGFGLPGLEAMAHGAPVASSNATCLPEIYGNGAIYFDPKNTVDMAAKIDQLISNDSLRAEMIKKGMANSIKYSWSKTAEQTLSVYNKVIN